ncbi:hypothetical protein Trydic_g4535 [Trypoxylus dichotomus]
MTRRRTKRERRLPLTPHRRTTKTEIKQRTALSTRQLRGPHHRHTYTTNNGHLRNCDMFLSLLQEPFERSLEADSCV